MPRLSYEQSVTELKRRLLLSDEEQPALATGIPSPDDEDPDGLSFFRTRVEGDLSGLSIPRTLFCRSEVRECRFVGTDLSESFLCWNDFADVDFSSAILKGADLRSSVYVRVRFTGADLTGVDLRHATFEHCDFAGAMMSGAKMSRLQSSGLNLSPEQKKQIEWKLFSGDEPPGG
jgi:BTB/POZ domain-containing protein KCTD9